jgi:hypothetical protein
MAIDHTGVLIEKSQHATIVEWYKAALAPLGYAVYLAVENHATGFSDDKRHADFWVIGVDSAPNIGMHYAFVAKGKSCTYRGSFRAMEESIVID